MSRAGSEPPRGQPYTSTPPPNRTRPRPPPSVLSPLSTLSTNSPNDSFRSSSYQPSLYSQSSLSAAPLSRYINSTSTSSASIAPSSFSVAPSNAGSLATTTNPSGPTRFKRGHVRKAGRGVQSPPAVKTSNPDEVDLMALEEPDEVFRMFGVRDVRKLEKRASDAAAAKVADLRTMVGERYRDLLAAADSIVRMRSAAEKLVDRLDNVEDAILGAGAAINDTPSKPGPSRRASRRSLSPTRERTLSSAPTLSLTIHLLLTIPSLVHTQLETSSFLFAARLETLGQVVYRELSEYEPEEEDGLVDDEGRPRSLLETFPIVEKQHEALSALKPVILRRATAELRVWDSAPLNTAQTLAATVILQNSSLSVALSTFLTARSEALSRILDAPSPSQLGTADAAKSLQEVLGLVLRTVENVVEIFGTEGREGTLAHLLREVERPSLTSADNHQESTVYALPPILTTLPNYATLAKHLSTSLLLFSPSIPSPSSLSTAPTVDAQLSAWLDTEIDRVVTGVNNWISSFSSPSSPVTSASTFGAKPLSQLRTALLAILSSAAPSSASAADSLRNRLSRTIEHRLSEVYTTQLNSLVARVQPALSALLLALPADSSAIDRDPAKFLFDSPLPFPSLSSSSSAFKTAGGSDPFEVFLGRVEKRVAGRSPLLDKGVGELEAAAKEVRVDLEGWLGASSDAEGVEDRERLRVEYFDAVRNTLEGIVEALEAVLGETEGQVDESLFVGNFVGLLASSRTFIQDLVLGVSAAGSSHARSMLATWHTRLADLQNASLTSWRAQAVAKAVKKLEESMNEVAASAPLAALWAWDASRASPPATLPSAPSAAVLSSLHSLASSLNILPQPRRSNPRISQELLAAFAAEATQVALAFVETLEGGEVEDKGNVAKQAAWDVRLLRRVVDVAAGAGVEVASRQLETLEERFLSIDSSSLDPSTAASHLSDSTLLYLQRTQSLFAPLLPFSSTPSSTSSTVKGAPKPTVSLALFRLLPLGPPPAGSSSTAAQVGTPGLVKPGPRLGLLPTRG